MTQLNDYGRREFLGYAALLVGDLATQRAVQRIAGVLKPSNAKGELSEQIKTQTKHEGKAQEPARTIADLILGAINQSNMGFERNIVLSHLTYRKIYDTYSDAIVLSDFNSAQADVAKAREYQGLEVVARMWQADLLFNKVAVNIIDNETINVRGFPEIKANRKLGADYRGDNLFRALENYEGVLRIMHKSRKNGLPIFVGKGRLGDHGQLPSKQKVYERMSKTLGLLLQYSDKKYHPALAKKKKEVDKVLENLNKPRVPVRRST